MSVLAGARIGGVARVAGDACSCGALCIAFDSVIDSVGGVRSCRASTPVCYRMLAALLDSTLCSRDCCTKLDGTGSGKVGWRCLWQDVVRP
jgi:hypothetical protein